MGDVINCLELEAPRWVKSTGSMIPAQLAMMEEVSIQEAEKALEFIRGKGLVYLCDEGKYKLTPGQLYAR